MTLTSFEVQKSMHHLQQITEGSDNIEQTGALELSWYTILKVY